MAWTTPITFTANSGLTAAMLNEQLRDNLMETMPAKATTPGGYFVGTGPNRITERIRGAQTFQTTATTTATSFGNLTSGDIGPVVTLTTAQFALIWIRGDVQNDSAYGSYIGVGVTGASNIAPTDGKSLFINTSNNGRAYMARCVYLDNLTPGKNTFTLKYRVSGGTGTYRARQLSVFPY